MAEKKGIDWNGIANKLVYALILSLLAIFFQFLTLKAQVEENTKKTKKIDIVAKIVCLRAIQDEKNHDREKTKWNAEKICEEILKGD